MRYRFGSLPLGDIFTCLILSKLGVDFGPVPKMYPAEPLNPGGYFERADINSANDKLIFSAGRTLADPGDPVELAHKGDPQVLQALDLD